MLAHVFTEPLLIQNRVRQILFLYSSREALYRNHIVVTQIQRMSVKKDTHTSDTDFLPQTLYIYTVYYFKGKGCSMITSEIVWKKADDGAN